MSKFVSDEEFVAAWELFSSPVKVAEALNLSVRGVYERRGRMEKRLGIVLKTLGDSRKKNGLSNMARMGAEQNAETRATHIENIINQHVANGTVVIFSDAHYWPGEPTAAHTALVKVIKQLKPQLVIANGDLFDGARISRHPRAGWEQRPSVKDEIEVVCLRMKEVEKAAKGSQLIRTLGNHDSRFENYIAANAPELEGVHGTSLFDFLPNWRGCWAVHVNPNDDGWTVIRHVHVAGGIHSAYNSTVRAGTHYVHGHLHKLQVTPFGDYRGRRYGVDTGTLADPEGQQFAYTQAGPLNWCSGFAVLTYAEGRLLIPELVEVIHGQAWFRGSKL